MRVVESKVSSLRWSEVLTFAKLIPSLALGLGFLFSDFSYATLGNTSVCYTPRDSFILEPGEQILRVTGVFSSVVHNHMGDNTKKMRILAIRFHTDGGRSNPEIELPAPADGVAHRKFVLEPPKKKRNKSRSRSRGRTPENEDVEETVSGRSTPVGPSDPGTPLSIATLQRSSSLLVPEHDGHVSSGSLPRQGSRSLSRTRARPILGFSGSSLGGLLGQLKALWRYDPAFDDQKRAKTGDLPSYMYY